MKARTRRRAAPPPAPRLPPSPSKLVAVIDIGASAVRLEVAEVDDAGQTRTVDSLSQPVGLGKDTFTGGVIQPATIEACVTALRNFRQALREYGIVDMDRVRAVATSAVREARNREQFLDRVYLATRIPVTVLDETELSRLTYLAVRAAVDEEHFRDSDGDLVVEVGGGSTELLLIQNGQVAFADSYRLGALRIRESLVAQQASGARLRDMIAETIQRMIAQMKQSMPVDRIPHLIAISGDARFAASRLDPKWPQREVARIPRRDFSRFAAEILPMSVDDLVREYQLDYAAAETLGSALLTYRLLARAFDVKTILVPKVSLRTALEIDVSGRAERGADFNRQIEHSVRALGRKFEFDERHASHVADLAEAIFDALRADHPLGARHRFLLRVAALLHDIGQVINFTSHHKHSMYIIQNSDLFGLSREEIELIALVARYHRRATPQPTHAEFTALSRDARVTVQSLAAMLRLADALDRGHTQRTRRLQFEKDDGRFTITIPDVDDITLERLAVKEKGRLFEDVFGLPVALRRGPALQGPDSHV